MICIPFEFGFPTSGVQPGRWKYGVVRSVIRDGIRGKKLIEDFELVYGDGDRDRTVGPRGKEKRPGKEKTKRCGLALLVCGV